MEINILLDGLRTCKPPAKFQDVCLKTFCAVRATLQLEDFNVAGLTRRQFAVQRGFLYESWFSFPSSQALVTCPCFLHSLLSSMFSYLYPLHLVQTQGEMVKPPMVVCLGTIMPAM